MAIEEVFGESTPNAGRLRYNANDLSLEETVLLEITAREQAIIEEATARATADTSLEAALKQYADDAVAGIVDSSDETLDTLRELATALGNDPNFAASVSEQIGLRRLKSENVPWGEVSGKPSTYPPSTHSHTASEVAFTASGGIVATDVGAALRELDAEKLAAATNAETQAGERTDRAVTPAGWNSAFLKRLERVFKSTAYVDDMPQVLPTGGFTLTSAPKIEVPALGSPPPGAKWVMDVIGMIRINPPQTGSGFSNFFRVAINGSTASGICGGKDWVGAVQSMCPVFAYGLNPPTLTSSFTVGFEMQSNMAATWQMRAGDNPVCRCYLVAA